MEEKIAKILELYGKDDQRTEAWHLKRGQMLTASEIYKGLADATPAQRHELIMGKLQPKDWSAGPGARSLIWGTRFEPIAKEIYCDMQHNIRIVDTTCIPHPTVSFLGASPDGIILTENTSDWRYGKLVEFKCPISRQFTDQTPIPDAYYHQMQLQMECTGIDECEYIEMQFKEMTYTEWIDSTCPYKSFFAVSDDDCYILKHFKDERTIPQWREQVLGEKCGEWRLYYWGLTNWRATTLKKQQNWLDQHLPALQKVWDEIQEYRKSGTLPQSPKEKTTLFL
jgi:putative phage-type endonuclease